MNLEDEARLEGYKQGHWDAEDSFSHYIDDLDLDMQDLEDERDELRRKLDTATAKLLTIEQYITNAVNVLLPRG